jgi:hypothetical protein
MSIDMVRFKRSINSDLASLLRIAAAFSATSEFAVPTPAALGGPCSRERRRWMEGCVVEELSDDKDEVGIDCARA